MENGRKRKCRNEGFLLIPPILLSEWMAPTTPQGYYLIGLRLHYHHDPRFIILPISFRISHLVVPYLEEFLYTRSHAHLVQSLDQVGSGCSPI